MNISPKEKKAKLPTERITTPYGERVDVETAPGE